LKEYFFWERKNYDSSFILLVLVVGKVISKILCVLHQGEDSSFWVPVRKAQTLTRQITIHK